MERTFIISMTYESKGEYDPRWFGLLKHIRECLLNADRHIEVNCLDLEPHMAIDEDGLMEVVFQTIDGSDLLFVLLNDNKKNERILLEVGYAKSKGIPIMVIVSEQFEPTYKHLYELADLVVVWDTDNGVYKRLEEVDFSQFEQKAS